MRYISENNEIAFEIITDIQELKFSFETKKDADLVKTLINKSSNAEQSYDKKQLDKENIFSKDCQFISAARLGLKNIMLKTM